MTSPSAKRTAFALGALGLLLGIPFAARASEEVPPGFRVAAGKARDSVVMVQSYLPHPARTGEDYVVCNTGFFVDSEGHVLTSVLAVTGSSRVEVQRVGGKPAQARIWALHQPSGLALLQTDLKDTVPLELSKEPPQAGQWVLAACAARSPEGGVGVALGAGLLSSSEACAKIFGIHRTGLLESELPARRGLAAGPVLDAGGRLVGVVVGVRSSWGRGSSCYALPASVLEPILSGLMERQNRRQGWLGLAVARSPQKEGLTVWGVLAGSPAHAAGIQPGDVLLELGGDAITQPDVFESRVVGATPGTRVMVKLLRRHEVETVPVEFGVRPLLISRMPVSARPDVGALWRGAYANAPPLESWAASREIIRELRRENSEMRQRIMLLEQRLEKVEGEGRGDR